jgi:aspartyl-tRNA(Asn)/glutamyl-tRNA(Gln) amidotransferase subunit B
MRSKEEAFDYRYFPEPDIPPLEPAADWVAQIDASLPELPAARRERYERDYALPPIQARVLAGSRDWASFFEDVLELGVDPKAASNWLTQDIAGQLSAAGRELDDSGLTTRQVADLVTAVGDDTVSGQSAKTVLAELVERADPSAEVSSVIEEKGLTQVSDTGALGAIVDEVIAENPDPVQQFRDGKEGVICFLDGAEMKKSRGSANPKLAQELLRERL